MMMIHPACCLWCYQFTTLFCQVLNIIKLQGYMECWVIWELCFPPALQGCAVLWDMTQTYKRQQWHRVYFIVRQIIQQVLSNFSALSFALKMLQGFHSQARSNTTLQKTPAGPPALTSLPHAGYSSLITCGDEPRQDFTRLGEELYGEATYRFFTLSQVALNFGPLKFVVR